jgi:hypothetical protein
MKKDQDPCKTKVLVLCLEGESFNDGWGTFVMDEVIK